MNGELNWSSLLLDLAKTTIGYFVILAIAAIIARVRKVPIRGLVARRWVLVVGVGLIVVVASSVYFMTGAPWPVILLLTLTLAIVLLARYRHVVTMLSGDGVGSFSRMRGATHWTPAVLCDPPFPTWPDIEGAKWVWAKERPTDVEAAQGQTVWHRLTVRRSRLMREMCSATLWLMVDDDAHIYVNQHDLGTVNISQGIVGLEIGGYLHRGDNLIEMEIRNAAVPGSTGVTNPSGVIYRVSIC